MQTEFIRLDRLATTKLTDGVLPISKASVWRHCKLGLLPPPIKLGPRITAWPTNEIQVITQARHRGADDECIRELVRQLVAKRANA